MNPTISESYKKLCAEHHVKKAGWGVSGVKWTGTIVELVKAYNVTSILDYGCGKGALAAELINKGLDVTEYDPAIPGKDIKPEDKFDMVVCVDVLEHIEPDYLDNVLYELRYYIDTVGFFVICLGKARKHWLSDGRNAHLIVESRKWWTNKLKPIWYVTELWGRGWKEREMVIKVTNK